MKKRITTLGLFAFLGATSLAYGQTEKTKGGVAINHESPKATLDIQAYNSDDSDASPEGILIPRISKKKAEAIGGNATESTLIYIKDNTSGTSTTYTSEVDAKGFYYMDKDGVGKKWRKVGGGTSTGGGTKQNWEDIRTNPTNGVQTTTANGITIATTTFFVIVNVSGEANIKLPDASNLTNGKMITVYKGGSDGGLQVKDKDGIVGGDDNSQLVGNGDVRWSNGRTFIVANNKWYPTTF